MCGICGFTSKQNEDYKNSVIKNMMDTIAHRGPDDEGSYIDNHVALGFRRLSIIDLSSGHQPMSNESESIWIVFNGEIYNFQDLRELLIAKGHIFKSQSDTEVILHSYEEWGTSCLEKISGMFAFAVWDANNQQLFLAVDRVGIKPLYYSCSNNNLFFASEVKCLFSNPLLSPELNVEAVPYHMAFLWCPFPMTAFKNINKLQPGHYMVFRDGHLKVHEYWDLTINESERSDTNYWTEIIREELSNVTKSHMISDVPIGSFLSGGIDSSAICSYMSSQFDGRLATYFIEFSSKDLHNDVRMDEKPFARLMADILKSDHNEIVVTPDTHRLLKEAVWFMDEPIGDPAAITTYMICSEAKKHSTVLLSGVGGDEVFAGYPRYEAMKILNFFHLMPNFFQSTFYQLSKFFPGGKNAVFRNFKKFSKSLQKPFFDAYFQMLCYFNKDEQKMLFTPDFYEMIRNVDIFSNHNEYLQKCSGLSWLSTIQYIDFKTFLPGLNLAYTDKMSMAASTEVRVPLLDHGFIEKMFAIPSELRLHRLKGKFAFKKAMHGILPDQIVWRKKAGFGLPIHSWISNEMRPVIEEYFDFTKIQNQGIFNPHFIRKILDAEYANTEYYSNHIWLLLNFQIWYDTFL